MKISNIEKSADGEDGTLIGLRMDYVIHAIIKRYISDEADLLGEVRVIIMSGSLLIIGIIWFVYHLVEAAFLDGEADMLSRLVYWMKKRKKKNCNSCCMYCRFYDECRLDEA